MPRGIIFDIKRFALHDGPGIRTTVFLKGCPLRCWWCHNPESQELTPEHAPTTAGRRHYSVLNPQDPSVIGKLVTVAEVMAEIKKDEPFYDESGGGVTFSGGEPCLQPEFLMALLIASQQQGFHTALDTSGFAPWEHLAQISKYVDLFLFDLKIADDLAHQKYVGVPKPFIWDNLIRLLNQGAKIIIRIPLIPGITDTEANLTQLRDFIANLPRLEAVNLLPYNPIGEGKYHRFQKINRLGHLVTQSPEALAKIEQIFRKLPFELKIGG
ncbi:glycyl-radical enzyme activating protein [candidate division KSB1 bacterium]|nr:glycyl-radical enzyme activating protein [candidate division KSB1 bacterium]